MKLANGSHIGFTARDQAGSAAWVWSEGQTRRIIGSGDPAPGLPGVTLGAPNTLSLNDAGAVAVAAGLSSGPLDGGLFIGHPPDLRLAFRTGMQAPGLAEGALFRSAFSAPALNDASQTAFMGSLTQGSGGVTGANDLGIWSEGRGAPACEGSIAPHPSQDVVFRDFNVPAIDNSGTVAFRGMVSAPAAPLSDGELGIWQGTATVLELVARQDGGAPSDLPGSRFTFVGNPVIENG